MPPPHHRTKDLLADRPELETTQTNLASSVVSKTHHPRELCPAQGQTCSYCHKMGHFSNVCQQAARDQRTSRSPHKKPTTPGPRCEHVRMLDQGESFHLPSKDSIRSSTALPSQIHNPTWRMWLQQLYRPSNIILLIKATLSYSIY